MKRQNQILVWLVMVTILAALYGWRLYARPQSEPNSRLGVPGGVPSGLPDIFHNAPPPKQP